MIDFVATTVENNVRSKGRFSGGGGVVDAEHQAAQRRVTAGRPVVALTIIAAGPSPCLLPAVQDAREAVRRTA